MNTKNRNPQIYELDEGLRDHMKKVGKLAVIAAPLAAHSGKAVDVGFVAHKQDPIYTAATAAAYINPHSRLLSALPTAVSPSSLNKDEDERARRIKFNKKKTFRTEDVAINSVGSGNYAGLDNNPPARRKKIVNIIRRRNDYKSIV